MNKQQFKQKLRDVGKNQILLAKDLGLSERQITNWNRNGNYPKYLTFYFENIDNKAELRILKEKIKNLSVSV